MERDDLTAELNVVREMLTRGQNLMTASGHRGHKVKTVIANLVLPGEDGVAEGVLKEDEGLVRHRS